jgi:hypothetical protein
MTLHRPVSGTIMEMHGETRAIIIEDAMTQKMAGTVTLHTADGIKPIEVDCSDDLCHINARPCRRGTRGGTPNRDRSRRPRALQVALAAEQIPRHETERQTQRIG